MENLGVDGKLLLAQIVNFLLFFYLVRRFIVKPFMAFLDKEKMREKEKESSLSKIKKSEEQLVLQEQKLKEKARKELDTVLEQAKVDGKLIREDIMKQAEKDAEEVKVRMKKQLEEERERLYKEIKEKIADVSMDLVTEGLKETLDADTKKKVTDRILRNINYETQLKN